MTTDWNERLERLRAEIRELEQWIRNLEQANRDGIGPLDIEELRVDLYRLKLLANLLKSFV